jgi:hypothetical protein
MHMLSDEQNFKRIEKQNVLGDRRNNKINKFIKINCSLILASR